VVDLAVTNFDSNQNPNVSILLGNGDGTFQNPANYELPPDQFQTPTAITASDLDGNDAPDVAVANTGNRSEVVVFLNKGDGTLEAPVSYDPVLKQAYPLAFTTSDFNGDGKADLVVGYLLAFNGVGNIAVFLGNGGGTLQDPVAFDSGTQELTSLTAADLNGGSVADLATTSQGTDDQGPSNASVLLGNGDGTFQAPEAYAAGSGTAFVAASDLNGDEKPDLATANASSNDVSILLNVAPPQVSSGRASRPRRAPRYGGSARGGPR